MPESPRAFDDDRWPDGDNKACCFLCGRPVDPRDPMRGSYTTNAKVHPGLPLHLDCAERELQADGTGLRISAAFSSAMNTMSDVNIRRAMADAKVRTAPERAA